MKTFHLKPAFLSAIILCLCFLLTSTGWLAWEYHLMSMVSSSACDLITMVFGYLFQAAGIGCFIGVQRHRSNWGPSGIHIALVLHFLCLLPSVLSASLTWTLVTGFLMNTVCGYIGGYYLFILARITERHERASMLGIGYSASIFASWVLSRLGGGSLYYSDKVWILCLMMTVLIMGLIHGTRHAEPVATSSMQASDTPAASDARSLLFRIGLLVFFFSIVNNCGFAFSSADLIEGVHVEFSRLFYAAGLILAGLITDRDRKYGAILAVSALVIPFILLSLRGEPVSSTLFWALNYFTFGFYSVYRIIVFSDHAEDIGALELAGLGLLIGRLGDAAGEAVCLACSSAPLPLICLTALFFFISVFLFFRVYRLLYEIPNTIPPAMDAQAFFHQYAAQHDLSQRECEVFRLLLDEKSNPEIAELLFVSDSTVKYHIHNLLKKTGCRNRVDLIRTYSAAFHSQNPQ